MVTEINNENFEKEVINENLPVLADFWASWCGPCMMMAPAFEEASKEFEGRVKFVKIDTEKSSDLASKYEIQGIPCLILMKNGKEIDRLVGFRPKEQLKNDLEELLKKI
ncbi:MAG: thioredoxin [Nanobdellota archaeon]